MSHKDESLVAKLANLLRQTFTFARGSSLPIEPQTEQSQVPIAQVELDRSGQKMDMDQEQSLPPRLSISHAPVPAKAAPELGFPTYEERESARLIREEEERQRQTAIDREKFAKEERRKAKRVIKEAQEAELIAYNRRLHANLKRVLSEYEGVS